MKITIAIFIITFLGFYNKPKSGNLQETRNEAYDTYCVACHQNDGKGQVGINPPLAGSDWVKGDKARLIKTVLQGLKEPIEVNGVKYKNEMPAHDYLEDTEVANLLTFVRNKFGETTDSVSADEVKAVRNSIK